MRVLPLLCCLALAGCTGAGHDVAPAGTAPTAPTAAASPPPASAMQAHASAKAAANASAKAAARASVNASAKDRTAAAKTDAADQKADNKAENNDLSIEGPITREKINAMCWMKYEKGRRDLPLDRRADLVNQCVAEALKEYPVK